MKKKQKMRSFSDRLIRNIILMLFIILGLASFFVFVAGGSFIDEAEGMRHEALLDVAVEKIEQSLSDVYVGAINHVPEIEENLQRPDHLYDIMERVVSMNPRILNCGISFIADYYPQKGHWFCPYVAREGNDSLVRKNIGSADYDYLKAQWFTDALKVNDCVWSKPFFEGNDSVTPLVSLLVPIHDKKGRAVAIMGADMSLEWLKKRVEKTVDDIYKKEWSTMTEESRKKREELGTTYKRKPYAFIITQDGTFIVHPDESRILRDNFSSLAKADPDTATAYIGRQMMAGEKGYYGDEDDINITCHFAGGRDMYVFYSPIKHANWSMGLVVPAMSIDIAAYVVGTILALLILLSMLVVYFVCRRTIKKATKPLKLLAASTQEVAKGRFDTPLPSLKHNDEIKLMRDSFEDMQHELKKYVKELTTTAASKAALENELSIAHNIQMAMLPKTFPPYPERDDIDIYGILTPAKAVGGDLFDFYIRDEKLFFCIGDVSGKGVPASLVMAVTRALFRNVSSHIDSPKTIIEALNKSLTEGNESTMFVTIFAGVLNLTTGQLHYCNAGHDSPLLIGRKVGVLPCDPNIPVGVVGDWSFTEQEADIYPMTTIFLFTDGLNEAENADYAQFGEERILAKAHEMLEEENSPEAIIKAMSDSVHDFVGDAEQSDDLTMLAIKYMKK